MKYIKHVDNGAMRAIGIDNYKPLLNIIKEKVNLESN
ncbi:TPA: acyltransferase [Clostridioides difficile]|nr:acyltransferase [Clostridioides difficile]HCQ5811135.1 acyltransferase [Clostridioides difficile]